MNQALLDTDIYSEVLKAVDQTVKANAIAYRKIHGVLTISAVTLMEITQGHCQKQALRQLQHFLASVAVEEVLPFDRATAELAGRIAGELGRVGRPIGLADPMIAAIALQHGLELVTGNTAHFQRIQQIGCERPVDHTAWMKRAAPVHRLGVGPPDPPLDARCRRSGRGAESGPPATSFSIFSFFGPGSRRARG